MCPLTACIWDPKNITKKGFHPSVFDSFTITIICNVSQNRKREILAIFIMARSFKSHVLHFPYSALPNRRDIGQHCKYCMEALFTTVPRDAPSHQIPADETGSFPKQARKDCIRCTMFLQIPGHVDPRLEKSLTSITLEKLIFKPGHISHRFVTLTARASFRYDTLWCAC